MAKILTYNVNGIRAALNKGFDHWLKSSNPDIVCLQEIKAKPEQFNEEAFNKRGYKCFINSAEKPGYSGVAILSKITPNHVEFGCGIEEIDLNKKATFKDYLKSKLFFMPTITLIQSSLYIILLTVMLLSVGTPISKNSPNW